MVPTKKLVYDFRRKYSRTTSNQNLVVVDIIGYLNESLEYIYEMLVDNFELNAKYTNILRKMEVKRLKLPCQESNSEYCFVKYPEDLYRKTNIFIEASKEGCEKDKTFICIDVQTDDEGESVRSPYQKANFYYEQIFGNESGEGYYVYHQSNMDIKNTYVTYLKRPKELHAPSLVECDNDEYYYDYCGRKITEDSNLEFDNTFIGNMIVNVAVLLASTTIKDMSLIQGQINTILNIK